MNKNNRLNHKVNTKLFKDDDYETTNNILKDLLPFIEDYNIIYDPFYCNGLVIDEWKKLNKICINEKKDAFNREHPNNFDILISNIPFSCKEKCIELGFELNKPFIMLMPIDTLGSKWIKKYFNKLEFIIPNGRYNFYKKNQEKKSSSWFDTMWICYGLNLENKIIKI
jgi:hypothetical protein